MGTIEDDDQPPPKEGANDETIKVITKACRMCGNPIPLVALKCSECDSFQDWRGRISINATILSMLTALLATTISAIPVIERATALHNSNIHATLSTITDRKINFLLINAGDRPGAITNGALFNPDLPRQTGADSDYIMPDTIGRGSVLVRPGEAKEASFRLTPSVRGAFSIFGSHRDGACYGRLEEIDFHGVSVERAFEFQCKQIEEALLSIDDGAASDEGGQDEK